MKFITKGPRGVTAACLVLILSAGCESFLDVENPASLLDADLGRPELIQTLANTSEGNLAGQLGSLNTRSGMLADELMHPSTQLENIDAMQGNRLASSSAVEGHWRDLARGRWLSDEMAVRLAEAVSNPTSNADVANAHFFAGFARIEMANHFNVITYGPEDTPKGPIDVLYDAIASFTTAATIAAAAGDANLQAAALGQVARGYRSLYFEEMHLKNNTDLGLMSQAETAALSALAASGSYNKSLKFGSPGGNNSAVGYGGPFSGGLNTVVDGDANLRPADPVTGLWDPRIPHTSLNNVADDTFDIGQGFGFTAVFTKFNQQDDPLPISRAAEAMLIIAESQLLAGSLQNAVTRINQVRADARSRVSGSDWGGGPSRGWPPVVTPLSDLQDMVYVAGTTTAADVYDQIKHERKVEFFEELRRWADMRYYRIVPARWLAPNVAAGMDLRWPPAPEEIAANPNLTIGQTLKVCIAAGCPG
ncbi:MAG: RagB/SusD family nutrient uptake outer membrane protein [Gemmatimonadetes bacterium]|nr:RagB/SusD family nutrient uptake outer membrane protein [Gemmatimonadota bacterium]